MRPNILNGMVQTVCSPAQQQPQLSQHQQPQLSQHQQPQLSHPHPIPPPISQPLVQHQNFRHDPTLEILQQTVQGTIYECDTQV